ncbi:hypothetical protein [Roseburia inulinivorans]|jgi:hypothetical protein|uniref:Lipid A core-O-antigen ligase and related enzymes n=1 Tax=Roseburia inulinivorans TaxID=360807 RepID=A0A173V8W5_9FIRM|nr:hypothetical protein [Roseburia inulinivorans]CUN23703.1 Uncharacterised protein [Roseburia inulinivorans]
MNILIEKFKQRNEISTIFLYILYFLLGMYYPLFSFMRQTVPQYWNQVTLFYHILLILLLVKVILQKNSVLDCFFLIVLLYLCYKSYQYNYDFYNIFGTMMFLCCAKNIEIKKIVKLDLYVRIVRSALFLTLPFMGLMINKINVWIGGRTRTFFGWTHANMMGLDFLLLAMDIMYLRKECKKWYDCILYAGFIIFLDLTANSRTAEAVIAMLIVIHLLSIVIPKNWFHKMMVLFTSGAFLLCVCIPFIGSYLYIRKPELFLQHDGTMLSRIQLTTTFYLRNGGVGFYGFPIEDEDCLDMMFSYIGLHWGIAAFIIIVAAITYAIYKASSEQNTVFLVLLFSFLVYGLAEVAPIYPVYSYFSLLLGYYIMNHKPFSLHIKGKTIAF